MIEVPPPSSSTGRTLRYGAMTLPEYIWFRSKWNFIISGLVCAIAIWEFTLPFTWAWVWGIILSASVVTNIFVALNWRNSWRFWRAYLDNWLLRESIFADQRAQGVHWNSPIG